MLAVGAEYIPVLASPSVAYAQVTIYLHMLRVSSNRMLDRYADFLFASFTTSAMLHQSCQDEVQ